MKSNAHILFKLNETHELLKSKKILLEIEKNISLQEECEYLKKIYILFEKFENEEEELRKIITRQIEKEISLQETLKSKEQHLKNSENKIIEYLDILNPIYCNELLISDYKFILNYLQSLFLSKQKTKKKTKKKIIKNFTTPYIESLLQMLNNLEANIELKKLNENYNKREI